MPSPIFLVVELGDLDDWDWLDKLTKDILIAAKPRKKVRGRGKRRKPPYSKGELNKLIDDLVHPHARENPALWVLDSFCHAMVEQDPPQSVRKFIRYNLPRIIEDYLEK